MQNDQITNVSTAEKKILIKKFWSLSLVKYIFLRYTDNFLG